MKRIKTKIKKSKKLNKLKNRLGTYLKRRPHRSFRRTRRRDYDRSLNLPGYLKFTKYVFSTLWQNRRTFIALILVCVFMMVIMGLLASQDTFNELRVVLDSTSNQALDGNWGEAGKAALLFASSVSGSFSNELSEVQQVYFVITIFLFWLTTIWLLRNILAGHKVKMRQGLYNSGAPIFATLIVAILLVVQILPLALVVIAYSSAVSTGLLSGGIESMLFFSAAGLVTVMSLYFATSTLFGLVIITLPGMSPSLAIKTAGDLVIGRRLRLLARMLWLVMLTGFSWLAILIPLIMLDSWSKRTWEFMGWVPVLPVLIAVLTSVTVVWVSSYIYLLYRKVIEDESEPA